MLIVYIALSGSTDGCWQASTEDIRYTRVKEKEEEGEGRGENYLFMYKVCRFYYPLYMSFLKRMAKVIFVILERINAVS